MGGKKLGLIVAVLVVSAAGTLYAAGGHTVKARQVLTATTSAPDARGKARLLVRGSKSGRFNLVASHLESGHHYDLIVGGVKVGNIDANTGGRGRARFSTQPNDKSALLGFDPRGEQVIVRDHEDGEDVLVGHMPDDDPNNVACCLTEDDGESECEDLTAAECTAAGGTVVGVPGGTVNASCLPDPCATTPPEGEDDIVCCTNETHDDESEAECEDVATAAECATIGGMVVEGASCDANPCQATPPATETACCVPDGAETECEVTSLEACVAAGGAAAAATTCSLDPCGTGDSGGDDGASDDGEVDLGG